MKTIGSSRFFTVLLTLSLILCFSLISFSNIYGNDEVGQDNLVHNGDFEEGLWEMEGAGDFTLDSNVKYSGNQSVNVIAGNQPQVMVSQPVTVDPSNAYHLSVWVKTENISTEDGVFVGVLQVNENDEALGWYRGVDNLMATGNSHDWKQLGIDLDYLNKDTAFIKIYLRTDAGIQGEAWFDDVVLEWIPVEEETLGIEISSDKLGNIFTKDEQMTASIQLSNQGDVDETGKLEVKVRDYYGDVLQQQSQSFQVSSGGHETIVVDMPDQDAGFYEVTVSINQEGELITEQSASFAQIEENDAHQASAASFFGAQTHFGQFTGVPEQNLALISTMGGKFIRDEMYWGDIEKERGVYTFDPRYDEYIDEAVRRGVEPIIILDYGNALYDRNPETGRTRSPHTKEGLEGFSNYVAEVVNRYKDRVRYFEVWNEPNSETFWHAEPSGHEYAALLKATYLEVKKAAPEATVIGGVTTGIDLYFFEELFEAGGLQYMDVLSVHPYLGGSPEHLNYLVDLERLSTLMLRYGELKDTWITETGYPTTPTYYSLEQQAQYLVRYHIQSMSSGFIRMINWYEFQDGGLDPADYEQNFGLVYQDLTPKPSYVAYNTMVNKLSNALFLGQLELEEDEYAYVFADHDQIVVTLWATREKSVTLDLSDQEEVIVTDLFGKSTREQVSNGQLTLSLGLEPIYIEMGGKDAETYLNLAITNVAESEIDKVVDLLTTADVDKNLHDRSISQIDKVRSFLDRGLYRQAAKEITKLQQDWIEQSGQAGLSTEEAYALANLFYMTQHKLTVADSFTSANMAPPAVQNAYNNSLKKYNRFMDNLTEEHGPEVTLPRTNMFLIRSFENLQKAEQLLREEQYKTAHAIITLADMQLETAEVSAKIETPAYLGVWTSLPEYRWEGNGQIVIPLNIHNELNRSITGVPIAHVPEGFTVVADEFTLDAHESATVEVVLDGSSLDPGVYPVSLQVEYDHPFYTEPIQSVVMPVETRLVEPLKLTIQALDDDFENNGLLTVNVENLLDTPVSSSVHFHDTEYFMAEESEVSFGTLQGKESKEIQFKLNQRSTHPMNDYVITLSSQIGEVTMNHSERLNYEVTVKGTAVIDANLNDWEHAKPIHLEQESQVFMTQDWTPDDLSVSIWTMWDEDYFYIAAKARDDIFSQPYVGGEVWRGDGIQVAFDTLLDRTSNYNEDDYEYGFSLTPDGPQVYRFVAAQGRSTGLVSNALIEIEFDSEGTLIYEIAIPHEELYPLPFQSGTQFGFNVLYNENDGGERRGWLEWAGGLGLHKNPSMFSQWTLTDTTQNTAQDES